MKTKLLSQLILVAGLAIVFVTLKSDNNGKFNNGTSCASCHGNANANTSVALNGVPNPYTIGTTYPLTFTVTNATNTKAGFNIFVNGGTFTAGTGSKTNTAKNQITHTAPMNAVSNTSTFSFDWTAPSSPSTVIFNAVGNAVNGDNNDSGADQWFATTLTTVGATATTTSNIKKEKLVYYPNPTSDNLTIEGITDDFAKVILSTLSGQEVHTDYVIQNNKLVLNCSKLANTTYVLHLIQNETMRTYKFIKN